MGYPSPSEISEKVGNQLYSAALGYQQATEQKQELARQNKLKQDLARFADPNIPDTEKARIIGESGDLNAILKYDKQRRTTGLIDQYKNLNAPDRLDDGRDGQPDAAATSGLTAPKMGQNENFIGPRQPSAGSAQPEVPISKFSDNMPQDDLRKRQRQRTKDFILGVAAQDPTLANTLQRQSDQDVKLDIAEQKQEFNQRKFDEETKRYNEKQILPIQEAAIDLAKTADDQVFALQNMLASVKSGDVGVFSGANLSDILKRAGYEALGDAAQTEGGALFKTSSKAIFSGAKDIFPGRVTNFDAGIFQDMMANVGRDELANEVATETLLLPRLVDQEKARYTLNLIKQNPNQSAIQLNAQVFDHMEEFKKQKYDEWHNKLNQWGLEHKPKEKFSIFGKPQQQTQQRRSLSEILK